MSRRMNAPGFERHITTIVVSVILALLLFLGNTIYTTSNGISRIEANMVAMQRQIDEMRIEIRNNNDRFASDEELDSLDRRVSKLEDMMAERLTKRR